MGVKQSSGRRRWTVLVVAVTLLVAGAYLAVNQTTLWADSAVSQTSADTAATASTTVTIEPADLAQTAVSAAGNLELVSQRSVAMPVGGTVASIAVEVGNVVKAGDQVVGSITSDTSQSSGMPDMGGAPPSGGMPIGGMGQ